MGPTTRALVLALAAACLTGCPTGADDDDSALPEEFFPTTPCPWGLEEACADVVVSAPGAAGEGFGDPVRAINGVRGGGTDGGSLDVFSLLHEPPEEASLVLRWSDRVVLDGPGIDLVVFENAFVSGGGVFMDPAVVEVSMDGQEWATLPHDYAADDETAWSADPDHWQGFAGRTPVLLHEEDNPLDPLDPELAGGDAFDLADLPEDDLGDAIRADGFTFVRLTAAPAVTNPDTGEPFVHHPVSDGPDIDGVYAGLLDEE